MIPSRKRREDPLIVFLRIDWSDLEDFFRERRGRKRR